MMKFLAVLAVLAGALLLLPRFHDALPEGRLKQVVAIPGMAVSRMDFQGIEPLTLVVMGFVAVLLLIGLYSLVAR